MVYELKVLAKKKKNGPLNGGVVIGQSRDS